eukprot:UN08003
MLDPQIVYLGDKWFRKFEVENVILARKRFFEVSKMKSILRRFSETEGFVIPYPWVNACMFTFFPFDIAVKRDSILRTVKNFRHSMKSVKNSSKNDCRFNKVTKWDDFQFW